MYGQLLLFIMLIEITNTKPYVSEHQLKERSSLQENSAARSAEAVIQQNDYGEQQNIDPGTRITLKGGSKECFDQNRIIIFIGDRIYFFGECHLWITKAKAVYKEGHQEVRVPRSVPLYLTREAYMRFPGESKFGIISFIGKQPCSVAFSRNSEPKMEKPKKPEETTTNGLPDMRIVTEAVTQSSESTVTSTKSWEESGYTAGGATSVFVFGVVLFWFCLWIAYKSFEEGCACSCI